MSFPITSNTTEPNHRYVLLKNACNEEVKFLASWPDYGHPGEIASLRKSEFRRLDDNDEVYVDYTGGGLHAQSQLQEHVVMLSNNVFGNPHSKNPTSLAMTEHVERTRKYILNFFNASPDDYVCIFTPNASGALKLVGESYPFDRHSQYTLTCDNHNSVNGIREFAKAKGAKTAYVNVRGRDLRVDLEELAEKLSQARQRQGTNNLFAFPAQSNFSGNQHPLELIGLARGYNHHVLVDFAAFAPANQIDMTKWKPDFAAFSFYKIFGFPTGVGCLLVRKDTMDCLKRPWFAGGTVEVVSVSGGWHYFEPDESAFEDGTIDYLNIPAIEIGLRTIERLGIDKIKGRVKALAGYMIENILKLQHSNGQPLVQLFGSQSSSGRGGTVTFLLKDPDGVVLDEDRVEELANDAHISLRTGCFCNPGCAEAAFKLDFRHTGGFNIATTSMKNISKKSYKEFLFKKFQVPVAAIRISFGLASNFQDVCRVLSFLESFIDKPSAEVGGVVLRVDSSVMLTGSKNKLRHEGERQCDKKTSSPKLAKVPIRRGMVMRLFSKLSKSKSPSKDAETQEMMATGKIAGRGPGKRRAKSRVQALLQECEEETAQLSEDDDRGDIIVRQEVEV